jgi:bifunctional non-homologous end joining protein LigD
MPPASALQDFFWDAALKPYASIGGERENGMANKKLTEYQRKRDFSKTPEPSGRKSAALSKRLRFVVQKHDATRLHYDFRLELDGAFKSWAVTKGPSLNPRDKRLAVAVEDHPIEYGDFEGTIPEGEYGGGTVQIWDRGYWEPEGDPQAGLRKGDLKFTLYGKRLKGSWVLVRMRADAFGGKRENWLLIKHRDAFATEDTRDALLSTDRSVASGRSMAAIAAGQGRAPSAFVTKAGQKFGSAAEWSSSRGTPEVRARKVTGRGSRRSKAGKGRAPRRLGA